MSLIFDTLPIKRLEADLPEVESRTASSHTASWMRVKHRFPGVVSPVFHATTGPRAARIALYGEGIKADSGYSNFGGQEGVSVSRDLSFLLKGGFGNVIFVLDYQSLRNHFDVEPVQYPGIGDEFEERVYTDLIPVAMIQGVIFNAHLSRPNAQEWLETVPYPVVYRAKDGSWVQLGTSITATLTQPEKEDREAERLVKPAPQKKPPRTDLRRTHIEDRDTREDDADIKQDKKDQSRNYKDAAIRVAERHLLAGDAPETHDGPERVPMLNEKGHKVWVSKKKLKNPDFAAKYRPYKKKDEDAAASDAPSKDTEPNVPNEPKVPNVPNEPKVPNVPNVDEHGDAVDHIAQIRSAFPDPRYSKIFDNIPEQEHESFKNLFDAEAATIGDLPRDDLEKAVSDAEMYVRGAKGPTDVKAFAKALAAIQQAREVTGGAEAVDAQTA